MGGGRTNALNASRRALEAADFRGVGGGGGEQTNVLNASRRTLVAADLSVTRHRFIPAKKCVF